uniref:Uncharacterized protein n=1 Tax=Molossus molossus TaxID=27622 RepID=A0A7J8JXL2_MOLMO|nr:hypothetical protein HJG59_007897 [Molossus molossus]
MARLGPAQAAAQVSPQQCLLLNHSLTCSDPREPLCPELSGSSRQGGPAPPHPTPPTTVAKEPCPPPHSGDRVRGSWALLCLRLMRQLLGACCLQASLRKLIQKSRSDDNCIPLRLQRKLNLRDAIASLEPVQDIGPREGEGPQKQDKVALPASQLPKI